MFYLTTGQVKDLHGPLDAAYFSFVTASTVGYGDMAPTGITAKVLVLVQASVSFLMVTLVLSRIVAGFDRAGTRADADAIPDSN